MENETKEQLETQLNCCGLFNTTDSQQFSKDFSNCHAVSLKYHIFFIN